MPARDEGRSFGVRWKVQRQHGLITLLLAGEIDLASVDAVQQALDELATEVSVLVADLNNVDFMDSTGLRMFARARQNAEREGRRFLLGRVSPPVRRVIHVAGLVDFFDYVEGAPPAEQHCSSCDRWVPSSASECVHCGKPLA